MKAPVRHTGVDVLLVNVAPTGAEAANARGLVRGENYKPHSRVDQLINHLVVTGSFRKPNGFRLSPEAITKISQPPANLGAPITFITQSQNCMAIGLRDRVAMALALTRAFAVRINNSSVGFGIVLFQPTEEGWAKVETNMPVVVNHCRRSIYRPCEDDRSVRPITLSVNALVPIMKRRSARLFFHDSRPGIFAGWLVEMAVDDECRHLNLWTGFTRLTGF